jgi:hypothetical protein
MMLRILLSFVILFFSSCGWIIDTDSSDTTLSAITLSEGTVSPSFSAGQSNYTSSVAPSTENISLVATSTSPNANVLVNVNDQQYILVGSGFESQDLELQTGINTVRIQVIAENGEDLQIYKIRITR